MLLINISEATSLEIATSFLINQKAQFLLGFFSGQLSVVSSQQSAVSSQQSAVSSQQSVVGGQWSVISGCINNLYFDTKIKDNKYSLMILVLEAKCFA